MHHPVVVLSLNDRVVIAINNSASVLLGTDLADLVGKPSSALIPDYLLPDRETIMQWVGDAAEHRSSGVAADLLVEWPGAQPLRLEAHIGPADPDGEFCILSLEPAKVSETQITESTSSDDFLLGLMTDIGRIVGSSLDLDAVSQRFAISLMHVVPAEDVAILLIDEDSETLNPIFSTRNRAASISLTPISSGPISTAIQMQTVVLLDESEIKTLMLNGGTVWPDLGPRPLTACCVPLVASGKCIGVALLASALSDAFSADDLQLLEHASSQVAGAISNLMLHEQLAQGALEREVLANIGRLASSAIDFVGAMPGIAAEINRLMPISELAVYGPDDITGDIGRTYVWADAGRETGIGLGDQTLALSDMQTSPMITDVSSGEDGKSYSVTTAPLKFGGETIGTLMVVSAEGSTYTLQDATFASLVANQIAGAVHTARAYRNQQREANLRRSLAQISLAASRDLKPERVFERIANEVAELIEYDLFAVALVKPDRTGLSVRFHIGNDEVLRVYESAVIEPSVETTEWRESVQGTIPEKSRYTILAGHGINSLIEVSLGNRETGATGYLLVGARDESAFSSQELRTLVHVAEQVTPAIQNATAHEQAVALAESRMSEARAEARNLELEKINDAKSRFLSIVSHELRTPLTSIIAYAELMERNTGGNLSEKQLTQAAIINKSAMHLKFLISDLLDVSRIESGNLSLDMSVFEISDVVRDAVDQFEPVLAEKDQEFDVHISRESIRLHADRSRIVQVISNLVENASKYSPEKTVITLNVHRRGNEALISVTDEGIGISTEDQRQLFVAFFRANSDLTRTEPGTGLGLSLVKNIAELHGGSVSVKSEPGKGSTFSVVLRAISNEQAA